MDQPMIDPASFDRILGGQKAERKNCLSCVSFYSADPTKLVIGGSLPNLYFLDINSGMLAYVLG